MGLLDKLNNGETSLKSIPFGNDQPGGGSSKQPYIRKSIDEKTTNPAYNNEFIIRGGIEAPFSAVDDVTRLTKYFLDVQNPQGLLFAAKQEILSRTGTKTEASKGAGYLFGALNEGVYTPLSTVAQAGVGFLGIHLNKQGIDPTSLIPGLGIKKYQDVISQNQLTKNIFTGGYDLENNRLIKLTEAITNNRGVNNFGGVVGYSLNPSVENDVLISYGGGSDSTLGIGKTKIRFATDVSGNPIKTLTGGPKDYPTSQPYSYRDQDKYQLPVKASVTYNNLISAFSSNFINYDLVKNGLESYQLGFPTSVYISGSLESNDSIGKGSWTQQDFISQSLDETTDIKEDFRKKLNIDSAPTILSVSPSYIDKNIERNFNLGNPGRKGNISSYTKGKQGIYGEGSLGPVDKVTAYPIYKTNTRDGSRYPGASGGTEFEETLKDIVPFYIAILNNDSQVDGTYKKYMHFRAFIDNISDSYNADWKSMEYMGRAEKFYKYSGFDRKMDLSFKVVAQSREELNVMYDKLNFLASSLAPEYLDSETSGYMAGNIAYITLGSYIDDQPGIITSLDLSIPEDSPWEIGIKDNGDPTSTKDIRQLPHMIEVKLNFIPLQKFRVEKQSFVNDKLGTNSTRLLSTGNQRFIDQKRPKVLNYDKEAHAQFKAEEKAAADALQAENDRIALQNSVTTGVLLESPSLQNTDVTLGNQSNQVVGFNPGDSVFSNTLF
jgi:hypothetical protein